MKSLLREIIITVISAFIIFIVITQTLQTFVIVMSSMEPSFHDDQRILVNKAVYIFGEPEMGDVVIFKAPNGRQGDYIKRVIGLPGDTIEVKNGAVYVNGTSLNEPYIKNHPRYTLEPQKIPENRYFVLGDNRDNSNDSHSGWTVPREDIIGKAWISTWPPNNWGIVPAYPLQEQLDN